MTRTNQRKRMILVMLVVCFAVLPLLANAETKPVITKQPVDASAVEGETVTFSVTANGATEYQWYSRPNIDVAWSAITSDGTDATYTMQATAAKNGYLFRCTVKNAEGTVDSDAAKLTVFSTPVIVTQPIDMNVDAGDTVTFSVEATGEGLSYQWFYQVPGETVLRSVETDGDSDTLTLTAKAQYDGYLYCCKVTNAADTVTSDTALLTVANTIIIDQPADQTVNASTTAAFKVKGSEGSTYQWYSRSSDADEWAVIKENGTSATYSFTASPLHNGKQFRCKVTDSTGYVFSDVAKLTVISKPVITGQPVSVRVKEGEPVIFSVTAEGATSYQWLYHESMSANWKEMEGETNPDLNLIAESQNDGYQFCCKVINSVDSTLSAVATLTVDSKPLIIKQPVSFETVEGDIVTFKVSSSNTDLYQWYSRASDSDPWKAVLENGNKASYSFTAKMKNNGSQYRCKLTNSIGSVYTNTVTLTVNGKPVFTIQPKDAKVVAGEVAAFTVAASGADSYQWYYRTSSTDVWTPIGDADSETFTIKTEANYDGFQFRCLAKNKYGNAYSDAATLTVVVAPIISTQPKDVTVKEGETASFKVVSKNADSHQWYYRKSAADAWTAITANGTSAAYKLTAKAHHDGYQFRCEVKNIAGATFSDTVKLTVLSKPVIKTQPKDVTVNQTEKATFEVVATGVNNYQWYYRTSSTDSWKKVTNTGIASKYSLTTKDTHNGYQFRCLVKNTQGSVYTNTVTLTVTRKPVITKMPTNVKVSVGEKAKFTVKAEDPSGKDENIKYHWYYLAPSASNWLPCEGISNKATYSLTAEAQHNGNKYRCKVSNSAGSVLTPDVKLTVTYKPVITGQPANVTVGVGGKATFKVTAKNATGYQWYYRTSSDSSWTKVKKNGTSATYSLTVKASHKGYQFLCKVSNSYGSVKSSVAKLALSLGPTIKVQPSSVTAEAGMLVSFNLTASNASSYQWYRKMPGESGWSKVTSSSGRSDNYFFVATDGDDGCSYRCLVKNDDGATYSNTVTLTILK